jgi:hypothetical protein
LNELEGIEASSKDAERWCREYSRII